MVLKIPSTILNFENIHDDYEKGWKWNSWKADKLVEMVKKKKTHNEQL